MTGGKDQYILDFQKYMEARKEMENDEKLCAMLNEYDGYVSALTELMQHEDYDAQRAISLTNDIEFLGNEIHKNPVYCRLQAAFAKLQEYACAADCSSCTKDCHSREEK